MTCTCPAGGFKAVCKHRLALLAGDTSGLLPAAPDAIVTLHDWLQGSDLLNAYHELQRCEQAATVAAAHVTAAKKHLGSTM